LERPEIKSHVISPFQNLVNVRNYGYIISLKKQIHNSKREQFCYFAQFKLISINQKLSNRCLKLQRIREMD